MIINTHHNRTYGNGTIQDNIINTKLYTDLLLHKFSIKYLHIKCNMQASTQILCEQNDCPQNVSKFEVFAIIILSYYSICCSK